MKTLLDNEFHKLELKDGIIVATWKINFIDLTIAKKMVATRLEATKGQKYPFLTKIEAPTETTQEARDFYAFEESNRGMVAIAFCIDSVLENFYANFFIKVNKPFFPSQVFNDETKAMKWLSQYVKNDIEINVEKSGEMKTLLDNEYHKIDFENGIIIATWKVNIIDLNAAKEASVSRHEVTSGQKYPLLIKMNSVKDSTIEARDFLASTGTDDLVAVALCVDSVLGDFISSFFVTVNKPLFPTKIFNDETKAKEWLEQFVVNPKTSMN